MVVLPLYSGDENYSWILMESWREGKKRLRIRIWVYHPSSWSKAWPFQKPDSPRLLLCLLCCQRKSTLALRCNFFYRLVTGAISDKKSNTKEGFSWELNVTALWFRFTSFPLCLTSFCIYIYQWCLAGLFDATTPSFCLLGRKELYSRLASNLLLLIWSFLFRPLPPLLFTETLILLFPLFRLLSPISEKIQGENMLPASCYFTRSTYFRALPPSLFIGAASFRSLIYSSLFCFLVGDTRPTSFLHTTNSVIVLPASLSSILRAAASCVICDAFVCSVCLSFLHLFLPVFPFSHGLVTQW